MIIYLENVFLSLIGTVIVWLFGWAMVPLADKDGYLPHWLAWAGQEDTNLDGDEGWHDTASHPWVNRRCRYVRRVLWLWRNPAQVLDLWLGATIPANSPFTRKGNPNVSDQPVFRPGWCYVKANGYWMLYVCVPSFPNCCLRIYIGWKLLDYIHNPAKGDKARLTFSFNAFKTRGRKP